VSKALLRTALCTAAVTLVVAACGSDNESSGDTATAPSAQSGGVADQSAEQILAAAKDALASAESVRVSGNMSEGGSTIGLNLALDADAGGAGTVTIDGQLLELIVTPDTAYLKGDDAFYTSFGLEGAAQLLAGKWLAMPADSPDAAELVQFADIESLAGILEAEGTISKGESNTINGVGAISLIDEGAADNGVLWVATEGAAYPLRVNAGDDPSQAVDFTAYGEPVEVTAPPSDQVVDLAQLSG